MERRCGTERKIFHGRRRGEGDHGADTLLLQRGEIPKDLLRSRSLGKAGENGPNWHPGVADDRLSPANLGVLDDVVAIVERLHA